MVNIHISLTLDGRILANLLLQAIWMVKLKYLQSKHLANCHEFTKFDNIFPSKYFPHTLKMQREVIISEKSGGSGIRCWNVIMSATQ